MKRLSLGPIMTLLILLTTAGCFQPTLADHVLCRNARKNIAAAADGESAPLPIEIGAGQRITIRYIAEFEGGSIEYQILDANATVIWRGAAQPAAAETAITPEPAIAPGSYNVIMRLNKVGKHTICWIATAN